MTIKAEDLNHCKLITFTESLDANHTRALRELFDNILVDVNKKVVLDFSNTNKIDASGIGAIIYLFKRLHRQGHELELIGLKAQPLELVKSLHLDYTMKLVSM
ncbi:MAG: STAS domain-containing protein [Legionella sp.]|jgi:anti-anti-sigma factor